VYTTHAGRDRRENDLNCRMNIEQADEDRLRALVKFTALSFRTPRPVPFGALIVDTQSGATLMRGRNAVAVENDPSAHAELRTVRLACKKRKSYSLRGYTLYSTCEPCPMCMANALWAGLDRVVYGATIEDANRYCRQIQVPAAELARRSDMQTVVTGPLLRELCTTLFSDPRMQSAFATWSNRKE
jgi:tRNA(Arg) A34 adenosine deaminase TadA